MKITPSGSAFLRILLRRFQIPIYIKCGILHDPAEEKLWMNVYLMFFFLMDDRMEPIVLED